MAVEATGSKFSRHNNLITAVVCLGAALWFGYDGWFGPYKQKQLAINDGKPTSNLLFNQYAPVPLTIFAVWALVAALRGKSRKVTADDKGLVLTDGQQIPYGDIVKIDKRKFAKEGVFTLEYQQGGKDKSLTLSDRKYDHLGLLLDEIIRRTGAAPDNEAVNPDKFLG
jgi:hypothetical protein